MEQAEIDKLKAALGQIELENQFKQDAKKALDIEKKQVSMIPQKRNGILAGGNLFKELPFFKFEPIFLMAATVGGFFLIIIGLMTGDTSGILISFFIIVIITWLIWFIKNFFYLPRGKKILIMRAFRNTGISISCEEIPKADMIKLDKNEDIPPVQISRENKHFEVMSGRPMLVCVEGIPKNISIVKKYKPDKSAKEFNNIIKTTWSTAWQTCLNNMLKFQNKFKDPQFIIAIITLLAVGGAAAIMVMVLGDISKTNETLATMQTTLTTIAENTAPGV